ncbi:MAG: GHKL domain-containing protein [[Clostridium] innocuum]|uniref:sensor histidine kinase n=1 Tax=Clostridium innocuum TaxID=1522 RepID=UPI0021472CDC|nr:GHKL domain-containing protein [[Clostridium] innocuum]MCR0335898.1 GHKL domain-containing protein [[Clostridium] innocuum]MCR0444570.1 GHKL domain-containing protein [[Clostridium] innocuum]
MHVVWELIVTFIEVSMTAGFVLYVLQDHLKTGRSNTMLGAAVIVSMISILDTAFSNTISYLLPFDYTTLTGMVWLLIAYAAISYATEEPRDRVLFLLFLSMNVLLLSRSTTLLIYHVISPELLQGEYTWMDIAGYGIPNIFITSGCAYITSRYYQKLRFIHTSSNHLYLVPLFFYFLAAFQINLYPVDEYVFVLFMKVIVILCAFMTYSQMIQAVINAAKAVQEAEFHKQLSYQLNIENTRISELESHAEEIRHIRHDRRQHVQVLRGLLEHEDIQKALEYLADYEQSMAEAIKPSLCENFVADTLCRRYAALAEQSDIHLEITVAFPQNTGIAGSDIAIILGNLWENAITAALDCTDAKRFICLWIQTQKDKVLIRMQNGYVGEIHFEEDKFYSTKKGRIDREGVGIRSIRAVAEKYGGLAEFTYTDDTFTASVVLYISVE